MSQRRCSRHHCSSWCQSPSSSAGVTVHRSTTWDFGMGCSLATLDTGHPLSRTHLATAANAVLTLSLYPTLSVAHSGTCGAAQTA